MKIIILSGGLGYRLKEETEFKPKPMVQIGGKPILWHIMKIYAHYGFNEFIVALGYKGDYIKEYFEKHKNLVKDFSIELVDTGQETLPGERILRLKDFIPVEDKNFMVTYGDGVSNVNIEELVTFHQKQGTIGTVTGVHPRSRFGLLTKSKKHIVDKFVEKPILKEWVNGGFMVFKKNFFKYLKRGEMEHNALKRLVKKNELSLYVHNGFWHSMDTYPDVDSLNKYWREDPEWKVWKD